MLLEPAQHSQLNDVQYWLMWVESACACGCLFAVRQKERVRESKRMCFTLVTSVLTDNCGGILHDETQSKGSPSLPVKMHLFCQNSDLPQNQPALLH